MSLHLSPRSPSVSAQHVHRRTDTRAAAERTKTRGATGARKPTSVAAQGPRCRSADTPCTELTWFRHERRAPAGLLALRVIATCAPSQDRSQWLRPSGPQCASARRYSCRDSPVSGPKAFAAFPLEPSRAPARTHESPLGDSPGVFSLFPRPSTSTFANVQTLAPGRSEGDREGSPALSRIQQDGG